MLPGRHTWLARSCVGSLDLEDDVQHGEESDVGGHRIKSGVGISCREADDCKGIQLRGLHNVIFPDVENTGVQPIGPPNGEGAFADLGKNKAIKWMKKWQVWHETEGETGGVFLTNLLIVEIWN